MRRIGLILDVRPARLDHRQRRGRVVGGHETHLIRAIVAGRNEDQAVVGRSSRADRKGDVVLLLVQRDRLGRFVPDAVILGAVAAPLVVDLGEDDPLLSLVHTGLPMPTLVTVSRSLPVARSRMTSLNRSDPSSSTRVASSFPSGLPRRRLADNIPCLGFGILAVDQRIIAARGRLAVPVAVLGAGLERPPVEPVAVLDRDRAVVLLDATLHLLEQLVGQRLVRRHRRFEIIILGLQIGEHILVLDVRIAGIANPRPRVLDREAMAV